MRVSIESESSDSFREPSGFRKLREDSGRKLALSRQTLAQAAKLDKVKKFKESLMRLGVLECAIEFDLTGLILHGTRYTLAGYASL